jgi:hypothetical protein
MNNINPFDNQSIKNDKTIESTKIETILDRYSSNMKNKKKWCILYWIYIEGHQRINDYMVRSKTSNNNYTNIQPIYKHFKDKLKNDDIKIKEIIECIKKQMKPEKVVIQYWRGDDNIVKNKNFHIETLTSLTNNKKIAKKFGNVYTILVEPDVKRIYIDFKNINNYVNTDENEILIEDGCFWEIIDKSKKIIKIHSPSKKLLFPYRSNLTISKIYDENKLYKAKKLIEYYCDYYFNFRINEYLYHYIFNPKNAEKHIIYFNYYYFIVDLENEVLLKNKIDFAYEYTYDAFNELIKDIYLQQKEIYRAKFNTEYLPKLSKLNKKSI